jgi:hypothetical protein
LAGVVGPGLTWNVLNYGRIRNNILAQDARFAQLVLEYQETVLRANEEVENALAGYLRQQQRVKWLDFSAAAAAKSVVLSKLQYEEGAIDFQRLLDSQRALVLQQDALAEARGNVALSLIAVYKALGGGWQMQDMLDGATPREPLPEHEILPGHQVRRERNIDGEHQTANGMSDDAIPQIPLFTTARYSKTRSKRTLQSNRHVGQ